LLTAAQLAAMRREVGQSRELLAWVLQRSPRWVTFVEEGRIPLTQEIHDQIEWGIEMHTHYAKDPGAVVAAAVDAAFPGSNLTSNQQSN
jgi:hypothetical protein